MKFKRLKLIIIKTCFMPHAMHETACSLVLKCVFFGIVIHTFEGKVSKVQKWFVLKVRMEMLKGYVEKCSKHMVILVGNTQK